MQRFRATDRWHTPCSTALTMLNLPQDLGQRILDAARIAAAIHQTQQSAGGAGAPGGVASATLSRNISKDGPAREPARLR